MLKAMQVWGENDVPDNPSAWVYRVARNILLDNLRKEIRRSEIISPG